MTCPGATATATASSGAPSAAAIAHAAAIKNRRAEGLLRQAGVQGVGVGVSDVDPSQAALVVYVVEGMDHAPLPEAIDGVPLRVVSSDRFRASGWNEAAQASCPR